MIRKYICLYRKGMSPTHTYSASHHPYLNGSEVKTDVRGYLNHFWWHLNETYSYNFASLSTLARPGVCISETASSSNFRSVFLSREGILIEQVKAH